MVEERIVDICAPTLAGIKCGGLFTITDTSKDLTNEIANVNSQLVPHGIMVTTLKVRCGTLVYVYRDDLLQRIEDTDRRSMELLSGLGYCTSSTDGLVGSLRRKTEEQGCVPHEIGLFLGYPYDDVVGFMRYGGRNAKCSGCWKVYGSIEKAKMMFDVIWRCREAYRDMYRAGADICDLAVS